MTRPDVKQKCLGEFMDWSLTTLSQTDDKSISDIMVLDGILQSLVNTHKNIDHLNTAADIFMFTHTHRRLRMSLQSICSYCCVIELKVLDFTLNVGLEGLKCVVWKIAAKSYCIR